MKSWKKTREIFVEPNGYDPTGWIYCECGNRDLFISDTPKECPTCKRKYITEVKVYEVEEVEI